MNSAKQTLVDWSPFTCGNPVGRGGFRSAQLLEAGPVMVSLALLLVSDCPVFCNTLEEYRKVQ